ncbi:MAG: hypothetical protein JO257_17745 [Deltaproteobacteria bacterium]|nr:hypothetical protein [Deltaproteobacteria bacterium]
MARWVLAALLVLGTIVMALSRDGNHAPVADLHADAPYYYIYLPSLMHGDLDFSDEYKETKNWYHLKTNVFGIGPAVFDAPLFVVMHGAALVTGSRSDGFSKWEVWTYTWTSLVYSLAAVVVAGRLCRRRGLGFRSGLQGMVGPLVAACAGPVVYYACRQPGYAHPVATFFAALLVERWDASYDAPRTWKTWLVLGACLGAAMLARPQLALWGVLLGAAAIDDLRKNPRTIVNHLLGVAAMVAAFAPQLIAWRVVYGAWWIVPQGDHFMRWDQPCWSETLFSSRNGLFPWSPCYFVLLIALLCAAKKLPRLVVALIAGLALQAIANGAAWDWWAGGSFGGRRFDSCYVVFAVGAAFLIEWALQKKWRWAVLGYVGCLVVANLWMAGWYTVTSARIYGADPASRVIPLKVPPPFGTLASWTSALSNLPARAVFAWKHDVSLAAYDKLVGAYVLGETYPGLNAYDDKRADMIPGGTIGRDGTLRLFVGLNRRGRVDITLPPGMTATWNGEPFAGHTDDLVRGVNELVLHGAPGTPVPALPISAPP